MPFNTLTGTLRRPYSGIGQSQFDVTLDLDLQSTLEQSLNNFFLQGSGRQGIPIVLRGTGGGGGGGGNRRAIPEGFVVVTDYDRQSGTHVDQYLRRRPGFTGDLPPGYEPPPGVRIPGAGGAGGGRGGGGNTRFSAYSPGASFYGGAGAGFGSLALGGTRLGVGGGLAVGGSLFAAGALKELTTDLIDASKAFESFQRTVAATEQTSADAEIRWARLLELAEETVGIDVAGLVQWNAQLRVIGVEADRVDSILRATVKTVSELGGGVHVSREALAQLTDGIVRNHLTVRDWRAIVGRIPPILEAMSTTLGQDVRSLDDFKEAVEANNITIGEGLIRSLEQLDKTAVGLQGTYIAATDRVNEATFKLKATLGEGIKDTLTPILSSWAVLLNNINDALNQNPVERINQRLTALTAERDAAPPGSVDRQVIEQQIIAERRIAETERQNLIQETRQDLARLRERLINPQRARIERLSTEISTGIGIDRGSELDQLLGKEYRLSDKDILRFGKSLKEQQELLARSLERERELLKTLNELGAGPGATSVGAFRQLEAEARAAQQPQDERPTQVSLEFFEKTRQDRRLTEEFLRADLQKAGGDYAAQIAETETLITQTAARIREALNVDTEQQTVSQQQIVQGLQSELDLLFQKLPILRELSQEQARGQAAETQAQERFQEAAEQSIRAIGQQTTALREGEAAAKAFHDQMQTLADAVVLAEIETQQNFASDIAGRGIGAFIHDTRIQRIQQREFQAYLERAAGIADGFLSGSPNVSTRQILENRRRNRTQIPSLANLEAQTEARFQETAPGRTDRDLQRFINQALQDGPEGIDPQALYQSYEEYQRRKQEAEREDLRRQRRYARQYQRIWENAFGSLADTAIDAIFDRSISLTDALTGIAQRTLKDLAGHYLNQFITGGNTSGLLGSATASGAGVALGGSALLFPQQFSALFEEIGNSLSGLGKIDKLFHSPSDDLLYAQTLGARLRKSLESSDPTAQQNLQDFSDNVEGGFDRAAPTRDRSTATGDRLEIHIDILQEGLIKLGVSLDELRENGFLRVSV